MRRTVWLATALLLTGCAGSGFYRFVGDTASVPGANPNRPYGAAETTRKIEGDQSTPPPILTEPGNIWPGPPPPQPSLADIERQQNNEFSNQPGANAPSSPGSSASQQEKALRTYPRGNAPKRPYEKGSSTPPGNNEPGLSGLARPGVETNPSLPPVAPDRTGQPVAIPGVGNGTDTGGSTGYRTLNGNVPGVAPGSIMVPNGNGTSTVIGPGGAVSTIPTPK